MNELASLCPREFGAEQTPTWRLILFFCGPHYDVCRTFAQSEVITSVARLSSCQSLVVVCRNVETIGKP